MADRIAIIGGEPYAEWIGRDETARRPYGAYRDKRPDGDARCVAIGSGFYVRRNDGDGMGGAANSSRNVCRSRRTAYAHCTTARRWLPSWLWRAASPTVSNISTYIMRTVVRIFGMVANMRTVMAIRPCR